MKCSEILWEDYKALYKAISGIISQQSIMRWKEAKCSEVIEKSDIQSSCQTRMENLARVDGQGINQYLIAPDIAIGSQLICGDPMQVHSQIQDPGGD